MPDTYEKLPQSVTRADSDGSIRLAAYSRRQDDGCLFWMGSKTRWGYGYLYIDGRYKVASRQAWENANGPVPEGLTIDHLCFNPSCVEPTHLEAVTQSENSRRQTANRTHCKHGHEFTPENTYLYEQGNGYVTRGCQTCRKAAAARYYKRNRGAK